MSTRRYVEVTETIRYTVPMIIPDTVEDTDTNALEELLLEQDQTDDITSEAEYECLDRTCTVTDTDDQ